MFDMVKTSITLFLQGRLFKNTGEVLRQALIGIFATAAILVAIAYFTPLPIWGSAIIAGILGGALQPLLFKNLKYA